MFETDDAAVTAPTPTHLWEAPNSSPLPEDKFFLPRSRAPGGTITDPLVESTPLSARARPRGSLPFSHPCVAILLH
jgi:hypothetical protein